jgi:soluble lytic murein transglycosylase
MPFILILLLFILFYPVLGYASVETDALTFIERGQWGKLEETLPRIKDPIIRDVAQWYHLTQNSQIGRFSEYESFLKRHPDWPQREKMQIRAELALLSNGAASAMTVQSWLNQHPPRTEKGKFFLDDKRSGGKPSPAAIKRAWIQGDYSDMDERRFIVNYGSALTQVDHIARTDRLLWEGQLSAASRMLLRVPREEQTMFEARIALMKRKGNFDALLARVPPRLKNAPGLLYERIRFRFDKKLYDGVTQLLLIAPKEPPYPAKWWPYRRYVIREEMDKGNYKLAYQLASAHGQKDKIELSEALWMKAWIELSFIKQPKPAILDFTRMFDVVEFPVSKSRAAYWVARAEKADGNIKKSREWLQRAAQYPTTFYGQIAFEELYGAQPLVLPKPSATMNEPEWQKLYPSSSLAQAVIQLDRLNYDNLALPLLLHLAQSAKTPKMAAFAAHTGWKTGRSDFAVRAAKEALNAGYYLPDYLFPIDMTPPSLAVDATFAYAIARQESMFYPKARSSADARGMMQVLPSTGRLVAAKKNLPFAPEKLYEQDFNFIIGSHYLRELLDKFGGTKIYAVAGYNAGPGRPVQWRSRYGALSSDYEKNIEWIERIPFSETRNYVQRVLENYQVYRALLSRGKEPVTAKASILP